MEKENEDLKKVEKSLEKKQEQIQEIKEEVKAADTEEKRQPLMKRLEALEEDIGLLKLSWKSLIERTRIEEEEKERKREAHKKAEEEAKSKTELILNPRKEEEGWW